MLHFIFDPCVGLTNFDLNQQGQELVNPEEVVRKHIDLHCEHNQLNFYLLHNGRPISGQSVSDGTIHVIPRTLGGKGGFGSMLRAIGAQIEKTTNREACRDLSGRRLRDINEEKRLKKWIADQAEREKEAAEKKKRKLEKLCSEPKHEFSDSNYDKVRTEMTEKIQDAVEQGMKASTEAQASTSKPANVKKPEKKTKGCLWVDDLDSLGSSDCDSDDEVEVPAKKLKAA